MKILYLTWGEAPSLTGIYGGQVVSMLEAARSMQPNLDVHLHVATPIVNRMLVEARFGYPAQLKRFQQTLANKGIRSSVQHLLVPPLSYYANKIEAVFYLKPYLSGLVRRIEALKPDIVHCRAYWATRAALAARKLSAHPFKVVFDPRGHVPEEGRFKRPRLFTAHSLAYWNGVERRLLNSADRVVCVTEQMQTNYQEKHGWDAHNAVVIPTMASLEVFAPRRSRAEAKQATGLPADGVVFGYSGALGNSDWHDVSRLVALHQANRHQDPRAAMLIVTRSNHEAIRQAFQAGQAETGLYLQRADSLTAVSNLLNAMDVAVLPYRDSSNAIEDYLASSLIGVKTAEYLAAGLPVVVNQVLKSAQALVEARQVGLAFQSGQEEAVWRSIQGLLQDAGLIERCRVTASDVFSTENNVRKYLALYAALCTPA